MEQASLPVLLGLSLPSVVDLGAGPYFELGATARDPDGQGVALVEVYLDRALAYREPQKLGYARGYTDKLKVYFGGGWDVGSAPKSALSYFWASDASASGTYHVLKVAVTDLAGNRSVYAASELAAMGMGTTIAFQGGSTDSAAPVLLDLDIAPSLALDAAPAELSLRLRAQDELQGSGVHEVIVHFDRELAFVHGYGKELVLRPEEPTRDGQPIELVNLAYQLDPRTLPGAYHIDGVTLLDFAGNRSSYTRAQLEMLGMDTTLTVANDAVPSAKVAQSIDQDLLLVHLDSAAWSASAPNSFRLVLGYSAATMRFDAAMLAAQPKLVLSTSVSGSPGEWTELIVTGTGLTAAEATAGILVALRPVAQGVQSGWQLREFSVNSQNQLAGVEAPAGMFLFGGAGMDRADIGFSRDEATVTRTPSGFEVRSASGQTVVVTGVERLAFGEGAVRGEEYVALDTEGVAGQAWRLYQAAVDRKPDAAGLGYWIHQMEHGASLRQLAQAFMAGSEFRTLYGDQLSDAGFIAALYDNVLHRAPDDAGLAWWRETLAHGLTREEALVYFSESAENVAQVAPLIVNGIDYTLW